MRQPPRGLLWYLPTVILLAAVYYGAARLGLHYASIGESVSLVWPPTGIAFAALLLLGSRYWPGVAIGAFLANSATTVSLLAAAGIALGNTLEALAAAYLFRRFGGSEPKLDNLRHVRSLVFIAAPVAALVSASTGVTALWLTGALAGAAAASAAVVWWVGDLLGALVVAPVLFAWGLRSTDDTSNRGIWEIAGLCLGTAVAAEAGLGLVFHIPFLNELDYTYWLFPFVIWAGLRFGARGASLMTLTVSAVAVWHTVHGAGPFVAATTGGTLFAVTCYLLAVAVTGMGLAAAVQWERQQATRALQQSEGQLRLALGAARMGVWFWSVETNALTWDERLRELFELGPDERIATYHDFLGRVHPEDRALVDAAVQQALREGNKLDYEFRVQLPDGRIRWIADQGEVGRDSEGRPAYMTGMCADVTGRRVAEERLRLAHRMDSVGQLAGGVAHEANNQMSVVLGATHFILRQADVSDSIRDDVTQIRRAAERTAAVTAQLLAFSRRQLMKPEVLDVNAVVRAWGPVLRRVLGEDCMVTLQFGADIGLIKADPGQLEQVLLNLVLNARDAMPQGGHVTIETFPVTLTEQHVQLKPGVAIRPGPYAAIAVSDTGHGMDRATLSRVFEPFFTTKDPGKGTGLGLSVVYGIVKQSDGYVWAYSELGQGTTFKIYLPLTAEIARPPQGPVLPPRAAVMKSVLVVEDEPSVRSIVVRALEGAGYRVLEAVNGRVALEVLRRADGPVDLVLTDVVMSEMGGQELAEQLAMIVPGTPIVFTSGYPDGEIVRRGLVVSGATFIQKPFTPDIVVRTVHQVLEARAPGRDAVLYASKTVSLSSSDPVLP